MESWTEWLEFHNMFTTSAMIEHCYQVYYNFVDLFYTVLPDFNLWDFILAILKAAVLLGIIVVMEFGIRIWRQWRAPGLPGPALVHPNPQPHGLQPLDALATG